jgi:hypothetical protein
MGTLRRIGAWHTYDVPGLVALLSREDPNAISEQLGGWWRAETTLTDYRRRLEACRDGLAQKWPPERSEAAAAFVRQVNATIDELNAAVNAISRNAGALAQTDNILSLARHELESINQQWHGYATREEDAEIEAQSLTLGEVKPTGLDPQWREQLNQRARKVMSTVERDIAVSAESMVPTPGPGYIDDGETPWTLDGQNEGPSESRMSGGDRSTSGGWNTAALTPPYVPLPERTLEGSSSLDALGPQLAGSGPVAPPLASDPVVEPARLGIGPSGLSPATPWLGQLFPSDSGRAGTEPIGRPSVRGFGERGELGATNRRVGPVDGVIGGDRANPSHGGSSEQATSAHQGMMAGGAGAGRPHGAGRRRGAGSGQRNDEWHVPTGGPAILEPSTEPRHDPGPGVIGIDR